MEELGAEPTLAPALIVSRLTVGQVGRRVMCRSLTAILRPGAVVRLAPTFRAVVCTYTTPSAEACAAA